jgi:hypothetical protein
MGALELLIDSIRNRNRGIVTYVAKEGLGNRLRLHLVAKAYSLMTGRLLTIQWQRTQAYGAVYSDVFEVDRNGNEVELSLGSLGSRLWEFVCARGVSLNANLIQSIRTIEDLPVITSPIVVFGEGFGPTAQVEDAVVLGQYKNRAIASLKPTGSVRELIKMNSFARMGSACVGIHIRRGDFALSFPETLRPISHYENVMRSIVSKVPGVSFFICSDNHEFTKPLLDQFPCKLIPKPSRTNTRDPLSVFGYDEHSDRDTLLGARLGAADCLLLSQCAVIVGTPLSSFASIAAVLGRRMFVSVDEVSLRIDAIRSALL